MRDTQKLATRRTLGSAMLIGAALMAGVDEIVFHQILQWHHFYDRGTPMFAIITDGFLHAGELIALVAGFFLLFDLHQRRLYSAAFARAGVVLGAGGFQLFDGIVDHKVLKLHQVRYGVDELWLYDLAWNGCGVVILMVGCSLLRKARRGAARDGVVQGESGKC